MTKERFQYNDTALKGVLSQKFQHQQENFQFDN